MAGVGEGRPGDVEPAGAGQQLVGIGAVAEEIHCVFHSVVERKIFFEHESLELHEFFLYLDYS